MKRRFNHVVAKDIGLRLFSELRRVTLFENCHGRLFQVCEELRAIQMALPPGP